jgi:integrase
VRNGQLPRDCLEVVLPTRAAAPLRVWTPEQTRRALAALAGTWHHVPALVAVTTGLRVGELLALTWDDLVVDDVLQVSRAVAWIDGRAVVKAPKSARSHRRIELYPETVAALDAHKKEQRLRQLNFPEWATDNLIFPARTSGGHWKPQGLSTSWQRRLAHIDVPRLRWHDLRHTHASHLLAAGVDPATVAARLGHSLPVCLRVYGSMIPGRQALAVQRGSAYLDLGQERGQVIPLKTSRAKRGP